MRALLVGLGILLLVIIGGGVYLAMNLNSLVEQGIETVGPTVLGVDVDVAGVDISLLSGEGELRGLSIGNPEGFEIGQAISIDQVRVALDTSTVTGDPIVINEIRIAGAHVAAQLTAGGDTNLQAIMRNVEAATASDAPAEESAPGPQLIIDRLDVVDTSASVNAPAIGEVTVQVPDINLTDIGREDNGATVAAVTRQVLQPVVAAIVRSVTEGQVRALLDDAGVRLNEALDEQGQGLMDKLKSFNPFGQREE